MDDLESAIRKLVAANRILAVEGVVDAFGHISVRHPDRPDRYLLSCSRSPELVKVADIMEFEMDGTPVMDAMRMGDVTYLSPGEVVLNSQLNKSKVGNARAWEYLCSRAKVDIDAL